MKIRIKKLNSRGFAHQLLIPVIAIVVVAGIGTYIITKSHANTLPADTSAYCTITGPNSVPVNTKASLKLYVHNPYKRQSTWDNWSVYKNGTWPPAGSNTSSFGDITGHVSFVADSTTYGGLTPKQKGNWKIHNMQIGIGNSYVACSSNVISAY